MKVNYQISAKADTQIQGITVKLSAEFDKGQLPGTIKINGAGNNIMTPATPGVYININGSYDVKNETFTVSIGSSISDTFLSDLKVSLQEFYNEIRNQQGGEI